MTRCARTWEVTAARDGRLGAKARADLERHLERCSSCEAERAALDGLAERLAAMNVTEPDDLGLRRLRARTLEAADAAAFQRRAAPRVPRIAFAVAVVTIAATSGLFFRARGGDAPPAGGETRYVATDEGQAQWSAHDEELVRHIDLRSGELAVWVDRPTGGRRVIVHVPDGEIEDIGTVFHVGVVDGRTRHVRVDEGSVVLRLHGQATRRLYAGETWDAPPLPTPSSSLAASVPDSAPYRDGGAPGAPPPPARPAPRPVATLATALSGAGVAPSPTADAADEEDRAYVEIVRLLREGREGAAHAAARDYVRRFPSGFRRAEVDRVLAAPAPDR